MSSLVDQICAGQIDWAAVTPENLQSLAQTFFVAANFTKCAAENTLNAFLHSLEAELMPRKYVLLLAQHMKLLDSRFSQAYLFVKHQFDEMMDKLSKDEPFMRKLASLPSASEPEQRLRDLLVSQLR